MSLQNNEGFSSESDDDDYVPSAEESEIISSEEEDRKDKKEGESQHNNKTTSKRKSRKQLLPRKRKGGIKLKGEVVSENSDDDDEDDDDEFEEGETKKPSADGAEDSSKPEDKARVDALWNHFLKDAKSSNQVPSAPVNSENEKKSTTKTYQFAGEEVKVTDDSIVSSGATKLDKKTNESSSTESSKIIGNSRFPIRKTGGLGSIMGKISNKTAKLSTLEKSRLDWKAYKSEEGIEEEVMNFNKGKEGYLERQAFLQRTDLRQFEIERNLRQNNRSNR